MKKKDIIIVTIMIIFYMLLSTINYSVKYKTIEYKNSISELNNELNEMKMDEKQSLAREKAIEDYNLKLNNDNIYYLEEENE